MPAAGKRFLRPPHGSRPDRWIAPEPDPALARSVSMAAPSAPGVRAGPHASARAAPASGVLTASDAFHPASWMAKT